MKVAQVCLSIIGTTYLGVFISNQAQAQINSPALIDFTGGEVTTFLADATAGWSFTVNQTETYNYLGVWDSDLNFIGENTNGLELPHEVGLWDSNGDLLTSTTIQSGTASMAVFPTVDPPGVFRWEPIDGITLSPGETYYLGAFYCTSSDCIPGFTNDVDLFGIETSANFSPNINFNSSTFVSSFSFTFPGGEFAISSPGIGIFGPNIAQSIPEPTTILSSIITLITIPLLKKRQ